MVDKAVQVAIGSKRPRQTTPFCETIPENPKGKEEQATQRGISQTGSYGRNNQHKKWRYDDLVGLMVDKEMLIHWLIEEGLMAKERLCPMCDGEMSLARCEDRSDSRSNGNAKGKKRAKDTRQRFRSGKEAGLKKAK